MDDNIQSDSAGLGPLPDSDWTPGATLRYSAEQVVAYAAAEVSRAVAAERERWRILISGPHEYNGECPDAYDLHRRDPECRACAALGEWMA